MTLQTVFKRLTDIDSHVQDLIEDTGMKDGYDIRPSGDDRTFSCGSRLEALVRDEDGCPCWVISRIGHNGPDYYLYGHRGIPLDGLQVRERRRTA